ncbi:MAG: hypothetical protein JXA14_13005 [Anaerolineae bacterium]|nr:hypothetical protein [Anaerolineae bacterium]
MDQVLEDFYTGQNFRDLTVLDPFMGGGTTIIEASKCNARTIGVDIDPIAWFITKKEIEPCPTEQVLEALDDLEASVGEEIQAYYMTRSPDGEDVPLIYSFWVDLVTCPQCGTQFEVHPHYQLCHDKKNAQQTVFCKNCHSVETIPLSMTSLTCRDCGEQTEIKAGTVRLGRFTCPECQFTAQTVSVIQEGTPLPKRLFAVEYETDDEHGEVIRSYKAADEYDIGRFEEAERRLEELRDGLPYPRDKIPTQERSDPRPVSHGYEYYHQLFNSRQLLCLSLLYREISNIRDEQVREYLLIAFSDALTSNNVLCSYAFGYRKLTPLFGLHAFNIVNRPVENNVWGETRRYGRGSFLNCVRKVLRGKDYAEHPYEMRYQNGKPKHVATGERITASVTGDPTRWYRGESQSLLLNRSSTDLRELKAETVDLILTDPPYYDNLSYSELSDFFYVWLRDHMPMDREGATELSTPYQSALYVNGNDGSSTRRFVHDLTEVLGHCTRVLKPDGIIVFTFHHREKAAWEALAEALFGAGLGVTNVFPVRSEGKSGFHSTGGTIKWDCVFVCRPKAKAGLKETRDYRGFLRSVKAGHCRWEDRLVKADLPFGWADSLSLGYAMAVRHAVSQAKSLDDVELLMHKAEAFLAETVVRE